MNEAVGEAQIDAVLAVPLVAREELIGLLAVYLPRGRELSANESSLLAALASQLAVAVQNAQLHERTERLASEREEALAAERESAKRLRALYEISRSFAQSLSLDATLNAVTRAAVELLDADAAVVRMQDERGDQLVSRAIYVADPRLEEPLRPLLTRDQSLEKLPGRRLFRMGKPLVLDPASARRLGSSYELLVPFLEQGSTAVVVPIATPAELLATLTVVSLDPERRIGKDAVETALFVAGQAALAIDNARLYHQQKDIRGHDGALAPATRTARRPGAGGRRRLRIVRARRGRGRRLRLPDAAGRPARGRARRRAAATGSKPPPTWRSRSSPFARSCASIPILASSSLRRTRSRSESSRAGTS